MAGRLSNEATRSVVAMSTAGMSSTVISLWLACTRRQVERAKRRAAWWAAHRASHSPPWQTQNAAETRQDAF